MAKFFEGGLDFVGSTLRQVEKSDQCHIDRSLCNCLWIAFVGGCRRRCSVSYVWSLRRCRLTAFLSGRIVLRELLT